MLLQSVCVSAMSVSVVVVPQTYVHCDLHKSRSPLVCAYIDSVLACSCASRLLMVSERLSRLCNQSLTLKNDRAGPTASQHVHSDILAIQALLFGAGTVNSA